MPAEYEILTPDTVAAYIERTPHLAGIVDTSTLEVAEVGDGNLNLVFVTKDADGRGMCLKQSLPYVRLVGESWPLTPERVIAEARGLAAGAKFAPDRVPAFYGVDPESHVLAMENLMGWGMYRSELNQGNDYPGVGAQLGRYVARVAFHTSSVRNGSGRGEGAGRRSDQPRAVQDHRGPRLHRAVHRGRQQQFRRRVAPGHRGDARRSGCCGPRSGC